MKNLIFTSLRLTMLLVGQLPHVSFFLQKLQEYFMPSFSMRPMAHTSLFQISNKLLCFYYLVPFAKWDINLGQHAKQRYHETNHESKNYLFFQCSYSKFVSIYSLEKRQLSTRLILQMTKLNNFSFLFLEQSCESLPKAFFTNFLDLLGIGTKEGFFNDIITLQDVQHLLNPSCL